MLNNYTPFVGKICTILTQPTSFPFRDARQHADFFSGIVTEVNESGIFVKHTQFKTIAFYSFPIVGIVEEQAVAKTDPKFEEIQEELKKTMKKPEVKKEVPRPLPKDFVSVEDMTKMAKNLKSRTYTPQSSSNT